MNKLDDNVPPKLQTRKFLWLAGIVALGIVLLFLGNTGSSNQSENIQRVKVSETIKSELKDSSIITQEEEILADKLRKMLSQIEGAGQVDVTVRLASSKCDQYAINATTGHRTTEEKDQAGSSRITTENNDSEQLVLVRSGSSEAPVVKEEQASRIAGILVVAEGAREPEIKSRLFKAVQVALSVEPQKILVLPRGGGD